MKGARKATSKGLFEGSVAVCLCLWQNGFRTFLAASLGMAMAGGQVANPGTSFENVSIKTDRSWQAQFDGCEGQFHEDGKRIDYHGVQLGALIERAFGIRVDLEKGPDSIWEDRYDIVAGLPPGAQLEDVPNLLRKLLAERFDLMVHEITRENRQYFLVVAKSGPKMKRANPQPTKLEDPAPGAAVGLEGGTRVTARYTMEQLAVALTPVVGLVENRTGLQGVFHFTLEYSEEAPARRLPSCITHPSTAPSLLGARFSTAGASSPRSNVGTMFPTIFIALRDQLGLELQRHVASVNLLSIDRVRRGPTQR